MLCPVREGNLFYYLLVWDAKSDWEPVLLTPLDSILELFLIFLQISLISIFLIVTRIFTVLDAYDLVAVIQLKHLHPEKHRHS